MKVLFLDIDGVLNSREYAERRRQPGMLGIDPILAAKVRRIIRETNCEVVLSSTWRGYSDLVEIVLAKVTPSLYGKTPHVGDGYRGREVKLWLADHPEVTRYAILDDDGDFDDDQPLFQTTFRRGLTDEIAEQVIEHLDAEEV